MTRAQRAVLQALAERPAFLSAQEIHAALRAGGHQVGLTSVYRALQTLTENGDVDGVRTPSGEVVYRRCATTNHHHHLRCASCGATVEVESPDVERWVSEVARTHGYTVTEHTLDVTGTCLRCRTA